MIRYLKEYRFYIILFLFVLIPVIAIDTTSRAPRDYRFYDRALVAITAPVQSLISWTLGGIIDWVQNYVLVLRVRGENQTLLLENRKLLSEIAVLKETERENERLRLLLAFREQFKVDTVLARVVAKDVSTEFRALRINRGEQSGIKKDMAVVTHEGIVGRVLRTTARTADIVTVVDLLSAIDAIDQRSRARGVVEGLSDDLCTLRYTLRTDDIQPGDILISSGLGGVYPKGVPVGTVSRVNKKSFGISQDVEVRPAVDFSRLEEVLVVIQERT